jgi:hypothetical protein
MATSPPTTEEIGAVGREIEPRRGICRYIKNVIGNVNYALYFKFD